jgi:hypothetical protein
MKWTVSLFVESIRIGTDEKECFNELWKWKLANWISTDKCRLSITR